MTPQDLVKELTDRCEGLLKDKSWPDRLQALTELHDQLRDDIEDFDFFCDVFPLFVESLIDRLDGGGVGNADQAQIYANSARAEHRDLAGDWLRQHANQHNIPA